MRAGEITVVMPAYRAQATIARTLRSVLAQEGPPLQVVVVVDGQVDETAAVAAGIDDPRVTVLVNEDRLGAQLSRNRGLDAADGEFVMFLDADDLVEGPLLDGLVEALGRERADVAFGPFRIEEEATGRVKRRFTPDYQSGRDLFLRWFGHERWKSARSDMVPPCAVLWRTSFVRAIGGWDPAITRNQDGEIVNRAVLLGARIATSVAGCGVYLLYGGGQTISGRSDNLAGLLDVSAKFERLESDIIDRHAKRMVCAEHDYGIAWTCFERRQDALGRVALRRARSLGFRGHWGSPASRAMSRVVGLRTRIRLARLLGF